MTKNADVDKYGYSSYGIGFDRRSSFSFPANEFGQNVLFFCVDMSFSAHIGNKKGHISSWKRTDTRIRTYFNCRKMYSINFTEKNKKFCLSLHYNGVNIC